MGEMAELLVSHLDARAKSLSLRCARDNLSKLDLAKLHDHSVLRIALVGKQMDAVPPRFRRGIVEVGGVACSKYNGVFVHSLGEKRAIVDLDAVIAFGNHPSALRNGEARKPCLVRLDVDIAHQFHRVGIPKHRALVFARHLNGLRRQRDRQKQKRKQGVKSNLFHCTYEL